MSDKLLAICYDIFDKDGNLRKIEVMDSDGNHVFDALWDDRDEQTNENRVAFREWTAKMIKRKGYVLAQ